MKTSPARSRGLSVVGAVVALMTFVMTMGIPIPADANQSVVPGTFPLANQPRVMDGRIYAIDTRGDTVIVGGTFTRIRPASGTEIAQRGIFKFNVGTGQIDMAFRPTLNGNVEGMKFSPDGQFVYAAGSFTTVNGVTRNRVVKLNAATGAVDPTFDPNANNLVRDLDLSNGRVVIGGDFRRVSGQIRERLAMLDPTTGAPLSSFNLPVTVSRDEFGPYVIELETSADGRWLVIGGNFVDVAGAERHQLAVIDLSGATATVADWSTDGYVNDCASVYNDTWIRGIDISPDNKYFVVNTTGAFFGNQSLCDTATRWELPPAMSGDGLLPTWINHSGGDTHWAAHITDAAVYLGGHQRWENNPNPSPGGDNDGPGAVSRPGIAAVDPYTGVALSWNPTRDRGRGVEAFADTPNHLFIGSDTVLFNNVVRQRLAVLPTAGGFVNPAPVKINLPINLRLSIDGNLYSTTFDGTTFGPRTLVSGPGVDGIDWTQVRDGFVQNGSLVYFGPDSAYFRRSISGNTFGSPTNLSTSVGYVDADFNLTPYDQPYGVTETVAAAYDQGRIYYTKSNDSRLFWRWYSIESGIIGGQEYLSSGVNFSNARTMEVAGNWLYVAMNDGSLNRAALRPGGGIDLTTWTLVDSGASGIDWLNVDAMFATQAPGGPIIIPEPGPLVCNDPSLPWKAVYHANMTLNSPASQRCEAAVDFNYGTGAPPGTMLGPNQYSIRFTRTLNVAEGTRLRVTGGSDDGIRIFIDGVAIIDDWVDRGFTSRTVETGPLAAGDHEIRVEYYENGGDARVLATFEPLVADPVCTDPGLPWAASYFSNQSLSGTPTTQRCEDTIDDDFGDGSPTGAGVGPDNFSIRYRQTITLTDPKVLRITGGSDDGIRVYVDGQAVIDDWFDRGFSERTIDTDTLPAGDHEIRVEYYENAGGAAVKAIVEVIDPPSCTDPNQPWLARWYGNTTLSGAPATIRCEDVIDDDFGLGGPPGVAVGADFFSARWTRTYTLSAPRILRITGGSDDGIRIYVDGDLVMDDWFDRAFSERTVDTNTLPAGNHQIVVEYYEGAIDARVKALIQEIVPPDNTAPNATITTPTAGQVVTTSSVSMTGTTTDNLAVGTVDVGIRNTATNEWLQSDGTFAPTFASRNATLDTPGATSANWSLSVTLPDGAFEASVGATDAAGIVDASRALRNFSVNTTPVDTEPADGTITFPANNAVLNDPTPTFTGGATDNVGVGPVEVSIRNVATGQWMRPDGTFQAAFVAIPVTVASPGATSTTWEYTPTVNMPNAQYRVEVRARDTSNNLDPTRQSRLFTIAA
jgi:hypothetical protein